jgi:D-alanyl-lipoteichoic acid acyltransferase DltB (MBOAT superfamily)
MLFSSLEFLFGFLPVALLAYHWLRVTDHERAAKLFLVAASVFFYGWWDVRYVPLVVGSIGANFVLSLFMSRSKARGKLILALGLALNLILLGYFKYANFFVSAVDQMTGLELTLRKVVLPLAISFFTFQQIAYLVEAYKDGKPAKSFTDYCLFVLFFPHLIAGPITHHKEMLPQFEVMGRRPLPYSYIIVGAAILVMGLAKKVVVADTLAGFANPIFHAADHGASVGAAAAWLGALAYTFQLYFDFSGYSDMAIGIGLLFGIRLPVNFASPYKSTSIIEFWRRWHISLSRFLRNYLYIPLGGNRHGQVRRHLNLFITMTLGGLWHGAGWNFLAWGALHGAFLACNHVWRQFIPDSNARIAKLAGWALTFLVVVIAWVLFKATTFGGAMTVLRGMTGAVSGASLAELATPAVAWLALAAAAALAVFAPSALELAGYPDSVPGLPVEDAPLTPFVWKAGPVATAVGLGAMFAFVVAKLPDPGVFLYFNF